MVESGAKEIPEEVVVGAIEFAHEADQEDRCTGIIEHLVKLAGKTKRTVVALDDNDEAYSAEPSCPRSAIASSDALDTQKHPKFESYAQSQGHQGRAQEGACPKVIASAGKKLSKVLRRPSRDHLPRAGPQRAHSPRSPRLRRDSRKIVDRDRRSPPRSRFRPLPPAAKPRHSSPLRSAPPTTRSAWKATKASRSASPCSTTTSRRSPSVKSVV